MGGFKKTFSKKHLQKSIFKKYLETIFMNKYFGDAIL